MTRIGGLRTLNSKDPRRLGRYALKFSNYDYYQFVPAACVGVPLYFMKAMHIGISADWRDVNVEAIMSIAIMAAITLVVDIVAIVIMISIIIILSPFHHATLTFLKFYLRSVSR